MRTSTLRRCLGTIAAALAVGCGSGGGATGSMALSMTDAPFPATEGCLSAALADIDGVDAKGDMGFVPIPLVGAVGGVVTLDLLDLRAGISASLAVGEVPTGTYSEIRVHVVRAVLEYSDGSPSTEFKIPSGSSSGLKVFIEPPVVIAAGQTTPVLLDFDLSQSFHTTGLGGDPTCDELKQGAGVLFHPVLRATNPNDQGVVSGTVTDPAAAVVADVAITAYPAGTLVDGTVTPTGSTFSAQAGLPNAAEGTYAMLLPPGSYDVYVQAQGAAAATLAASAVVVTAGAVVTQDLSIP